MHRWSPVVSAVLLATAASGCARAARIRASVQPLPEPAIAADSVRIATIAPGVKHRFYWMREGPWAVNVLDVDRSACWTPVVLKGSDRAVGRSRTSTLVGGFADSAAQRGVLVAGGVNGDFFSFAPPGVPVGAHVHRGRMLTGPVERPVLAVRPGGEIDFGVLTLNATATTAQQTVSARWNHAIPGQLSIIDSHYADRTDTATGAIEAVIREVPELALATRRGAVAGGWSAAGIVAAVDTTRDGVRIDRGAFLIMAGARAHSEAREFVRRLSVGDTVFVARQFAETQPVEAIGGFPMLLRADSVVPEVYRAGNEGFRGRHPRTATGIGANGRRLLLVTVDGRQPGYSAGMTLEELATLMRNLGATEALNLDGGGSTAFVVVDSLNRAVVANRPSDREGERPVANALAVERSCARNSR